MNIITVTPEASALARKMLDRSFTSTDAVAEARRICGEVITGEAPVMLSVTDQQMISLLFGFLSAKIEEHTAS